MTVIAAHNVVTLRRRQTIDRRQTRTGVIRDLESGVLVVESSDWMVMVMNSFLRQKENDLGKYATVRGCMCRGVCMCVCRCVGACRQKKYGISWWNVEKKRL